MSTAQTSRAELIADTALAPLAERGMRGLSHRAVDEAAGLPQGSTSDHARTRAALLEAAVHRLALRESQTADASGTPAPAPGPKAWRRCSRSSCTARSPRPATSPAPGWKSPWRPPGARASTGSRATDVLSAPVGPGRATTPVRRPARTGPHLPRSGMRQSTGSWPCALSASSIWVKGRLPRKSLADSGDGWAPWTTACRSVSISGSFFLA